MLMTLLNDDDFLGIYLANSKKYVPTDPLRLTTRLLRRGAFN